MNKRILVLENSDFGYWPKKNGDDLLKSLWSLFREGENFLNRIKGAIPLLTRYGHFAANASAVILNKNNNIVFVQPLYGDDAEEYRVELSRDALLKLINDWQALVAQEPDEIIMTWDEHGFITLEGVFKGT